MELSEDFLAHTEFLKIGAERVDDLIYHSPVYLGLSFVSRISDFVWPAARIRSNQRPQSARVTKAAARRRMDHMQHQRTNYIDAAGGKIY